MARRVRKEPKRFRIELGWGGLVGLAFFCFCLFLWMFLLGIWAGQAVLTPETFFQLGGSGAAVTARVPSAAEERPKREVDKDVDRPTEPEGQSNEAHVSSAFSLQVGAFRDASHAARALEEWRTKGYDAFIQSAAEGGDGLTRVFVGRFENLSDANDLATRLEGQEGVSAYITLLPAAKIHLP